MGLLRVRANQTVAATSMTAGKSLSFLSINLLHQRLPVMSNSDEDVFVETQIVRRRPAPASKRVQAFQHCQDRREQVAGNRNSLLGGCTGTAAQGAGRSAVPQADGKENSLSSYAIRSAPGANSGTHQHPQCRQQQRAGKGDNLRRCVSSTAQGAGTGAFQQQQGRQQQEPRKENSLGACAAAIGQGAVAGGLQQPVAAPLQLSVRSLFTRASQPARAAPAKERTGVAGNHITGPVSSLACLAESTSGVLAMRGSQAALAIPAAKICTGAAGELTAAGLSVADRAAESAPGEPEATPLSQMWGERWRAAQAPAPVSRAAAAHAGDAHDAGAFGAGEHGSQLNSQLGSAPGAAFCPACGCFLFDLAGGPAARAAHVAVCRTQDTADTDSEWSTGCRSDGDDEAAGCQGPTMGCSTADELVEGASTSKRPCPGGAPVSRMAWRPWA